MLIKKKEYQMRSNFAARMINAVTQQVVTNLPKIYVKPNADNATAKASTMKIAEVLNRWVYYLLRQPVNPFEQTFKNYCYRGDSWLYTPHDMKWIGHEKEMGDSMPVLFLPHDPMIMFSEPNDEINGEPSKVLIKYEQKVSYIHQEYPFWTNPKGTSPTDKINNRALFLFYFDGKKSFASQSLGTSVPAT